MQYVMSCRDTGTENRRPSWGPCICRSCFWLHNVSCVGVSECVSELVLVSLSLAGADKGNTGQVKTWNIVHTPEFSNSTGWMAG